LVRLLLDSMRHSDQSDDTASLHRIRQTGEVVPGLRGQGVVGPEHALADGERALEQRRRGLSFALVLEQACQTVQAGRGLGVDWPQQPSRGSDARSVREIYMNAPNQCRVDFWHG
jgi:hypothetical protein